MAARCGPIVLSHWQQTRTRGSYILTIKDGIVPHFVCPLRVNPEMHVSLCRWSETDRRDFAMQRRCQCAIMALEILQQTILNHHTQRLGLKSPQRRCASRQDEESEPEKKVKAASGYFPERPRSVPSKSRYCLLVCTVGGVYLS